MKQRCALPLLAAGAFAVLAASSGMARAASAVVPTIESVGRDTLLEALAPALAARGATATVNIPPADARRALAPCTQYVGFVPPGARLVGKTVVGVRCVDGANWQTFVAADVRVDAPVWQVARPLRAGEPLVAGDVVLATAVLAPADIEVALGSGSRARGLASIDGRTPAPLGRTVQRPVGAGRALAAADLREDGRVNAGEAVRVVYLGDGFSVSSEGRTVGAADPGSNVQIRLASGTVVNGTLRGDHRVELAR